MKKIYKPAAPLLFFLFGYTWSASAQTTYTWTCPTDSATWTVPPGVTSVLIDLQGAAGGWNSYEWLFGLPYVVDSAGHGARVQATLTVVPGSVLNIYVGGKGPDGITSGTVPGGFNGGGGANFAPFAGITADISGGGGGGASDIRVGGMALANRVAVAGGGGGAGSNYVQFSWPATYNYDKGGDGGGTTGEAGWDGLVVGGFLAGGGAGPGSGGSGSGTGVTGLLGVGGHSDFTDGGGGGGGGYWGGGGADWAGGGGGSSWTDPVLCTAVTHTRGYNTGCGVVSITVLCTPPVAGVILGSTPICAGNSLTLTDPAGTAGGVWSSSNTGVATVGSSTGVVSTIAGGTTIISYAITLSCGTATATTVVTVNPLPAAIGGLTNICTGSISPLTDATGGGVWSGGSSVIATIDSFNGIVSGLNVGLTTVSYTLTSTGCYITTTVNVVGISGAHKVCALDTINLSASSTGGVWSSSNTSSATIDTNGVVTGVSLGVVTISYTLPLGCTAIWAVSVNPHAPIVGRDSVCEGSIRYLTNIVGGGAWSSSVPIVASVLPDSGKVTGGMAAGITTISYLLPTGCLSTVPFTVVAYPGAITGTRQVCVNASTVLGDPVSGGIWSSTNTGVATVDPGSGVVTGVFADTADIVYTIQPGCPVSTKVIVNPLPDPITGPAVLCPGASDTMHDATNGGLWSSSALTILTVVDTDGIITGIKGGLSTIQYQLPTGCVQTTTVSVDAIPVPAIFYNYLLNTLYATLGYESYQWYDSIEGEIPGATSPSLAASATEYYYVEVVDSNGCKGISPWYYFNERSVGVKTYLTGNDVKIYPNPASSMLYIAAPAKVRATISSMDGKQEMDVADAKAIDISQLANGIYMVVLYDEDGVRITVQKLVKE